MADRWEYASTVSFDLSLAVHVTDGVTGGPPVVDPTVRVEESDERPVRTPSGFYVFADLPEAEVTVTVDAGDQYQVATESADLDPAGGARDAGDALEVSLTPTPAYEYPTGTTLVRGTVFDGDTPVADATVTVTGQDLVVETTEAGEFAYYLDIDPDDIVRYDPDEKDPANPVERRYKPSGSHPEFVVDGDPGKLTEDVVVEVGTTTTHDLNYRS